MTRDYTGVFDGMCNNKGVWHIYRMRPNKKHIFKVPDSQLNARAVLAPCLSASSKNRPVIDGSSVSPAREPSQRMAFPNIMIRISEEIIGYAVVISVLFVKTARAAQ